MRFAFTDSKFEVVFLEIVYSQFWYWSLLVMYAV